MCRLFATENSSQQRPTKQQVFGTESLKALMSCCRSECCGLTLACDGDRLWPNAVCVFYSYNVHVSPSTSSLKWNLLWPKTSFRCLMCHLCVLFPFPLMRRQQSNENAFSPDLPYEATIWGNWLMYTRQPLSFILFSEKNELRLLSSHTCGGADEGVVSFHIFCSCSVFFIFYLCNLVTMMRVVWRIWACEDQYLQTVTAGLKPTNCQNYFQNELQ